MGFDPIEVNQAAARAVIAIRKDGGVGYTEVDTLIPIAEYSFGYNEELDCYAAGFDDTAIPVHAKYGTILTVFFNGVVFKCKVSTFGELTFAGNLSIVGIGENTGEPFLICEIKATWGDGSVHRDLVICRTDTGGNHTVGIFTETIHPIDPKYLVKKVDLAQYPDLLNAILGAVNTGGATAQDIEVGSLWKEVDTESPLVISVPIGGTTVGHISMNSITTVDNSVYGVEFNLMAVLNNTPLRISVAISKAAETTANAFVNVEQLTIPGV